MEVCGNNCCENCKHMTNVEFRLGDCALTGIARFLSESCNKFERK